MDITADTFRIVALSNEVQLLYEGTEYVMAHSFVDEIETITKRLHRRLTDCQHAEMHKLGLVEGE